MMLNGSSLTGLAIGAGGFALGYLAKTIISYEYKSLRENRKQRARRIDEWTQDTELLLTEIRQLTRELHDEKYPDINDWIDQLDYYGKRIEQTAAKAPDNIADELEEELVYLAGLCQAHEIVMSELYIDILGETEGRDELPMAFEYDEVAIDGTIQADRLFRHMCEHIREATTEQISEVEDLLESPTAEKSTLSRIKQHFR